MPFYTTKLFEEKIEALRTGSSPVADFSEIFFFGDMINMLEQALRINASLGDKALLKLIIKNCDALRLHAKDPFGLIWILAETLQTHPTLAVVILDDNSLDDNAMQTLCAKEFTPSLKKLSLQSNEITSEGLIFIEQAGSNLQQLKLDLNPIGSANSKSVVSVLNELISGGELLGISLSCCGLNDQHARQIAMALYIPSSRLRTLDLNWNRIGAEGATAIAQAIGWHPFIKVFEIGNNHIGNKGAIAFGEALKHNSSLLTLELQENEISEVGIQYTKDLGLSCGLAQNCRLEYLGLAGNTLNNDGIERLATSLRSESALNNLVLDSTGCGDGGAAALAKALLLCEIPYISLSNNDIHDVGAQSLAVVAGTDTDDEPIEIDLSKNKITDVGAAYFLPIEGQQSNLTVYIHQNPVSRKTLRRFSEPADLDGYFSDEDEREPNEEGYLSYGEEDPLNEPECQGSSHSACVSDSSKFKKIVDATGKVTGDAKPKPTPY